MMLMIMMMLLLMMMLMMLMLSKELFQKQQLDVSISFQAVHEPLAVGGSLLKILSLQISWAAEAEILVFSFEGSIKGAIFQMVYVGMSKTHHISGFCELAPPYPYARFFELENPTLHRIGLFIAGNA